jgi:hypothetical protein
MQTVPDDILSQFNALLDKGSVPVSLRDDYRKWLRYFLDYCTHYSPPAERSEQVRFASLILPRLLPPEHLHQFLPEHLRRFGTYGCDDIAIGDRLIVGQDRSFCFEDRQGRGE